MHGITSGTFIISFSWILFKLLPFEKMCSYAMSKCYKKYFRPTKTSIDVTPNKESVIKVKGSKKYIFRESHPGYNFSYLTKLKHPTIPRISLYHKVNCVHLRNLSYRKTNQKKNLVINPKCMQKWHF